MLWCETLQHWLCKSRSLPYAQERKWVEMRWGEARNKQQRSIRSWATGVYGTIASRTHLLQEYLGFTPSLAHAALSGVPSLRSTFLPLVEVKTVMRRELDLRTADEPLDTKACAEARTMAQSRADINENLDMIVWYWSCSESYLQCLLSTTAENMYVLHGDGRCGWWVGVAFLQHAQKSLTEWRLPRQWWFWCIEKVQIWET